MGRQALGMFGLPFDTLNVTFSQMYMDRRTDHPTTTLLELLMAAKNHDNI